MKFFIFYLLAILTSTLYLSNILRDMQNTDCLQGYQKACEYLDKTNTKLKEF